MRYKLAIAASALLVIAGTTAAAASSGTFTGVWRATDPDDGSTLVLAISRSGGILLIDTNASACGGGFAFAFGTGTVEGSSFTATVDVYCGTTLFAEDVEFTVERVGMTLVGAGGEIYHRGLG